VRLNNNDKSIKHQSSFSEDTACDLESPRQSQSSSGCTWITGL